PSREPPMDLVFAASPPCWGRMSCEPLAPHVSVRRAFSQADPRACKESRPATRATQLDRVPAGPDSTSAIPDRLLSSLAPLWLWPTPPPRVVFEGGACLVRWPQPPW